MTNAVIVSTARTPLTKSWKGAFNMTHGATLGGHAVREAVKRAGVAPDAIEDVLMGCANPEGATGANIARQIALMADLPITVSGATVNRFCSSGLQTIAMASQRIVAGEADIYVAGGVDAGALDRGLDRVAAQRGAVRHVESALPALGQGRAGGGDDDGVGHGGLPFVRNGVQGAGALRLRSSW